MRFPEYIIYPSVDQINLHLKPFLKFIQVKDFYFCKNYFKTASQKIWRCLYEPKMFCGKCFILPSVYWLMFVELP